MAHKPPDHSATSCVAITPHASNPVHATKGPTRAIYVGVSGDIACRFADDTADVTLLNVPVGPHPWSLYYVRVAGTTATGIHGLW